MLPINNIHPVYNAWRDMKKRCSLPSRIDYKHYGGRGVEVCERWKKSKNFIEDMLPTWKKGLSLDRIDNNGSYSPENCKWSTPKEQAINRRSTRLLNYNGEIKTLSDWSIELDIPINTIWNRLNRGWSVEKSLSKEEYKLRLLTYNGETKCVTDWAREFRFSNTTLFNRLKRGWSIEKALTKPIQKRIKNELPG